MEITVEHLVKRHGDRFELSVPSLRVARGAAVGLVGNNGAGKTTLLRLMLDLLPADHGRVLLGGAPATGPAGWRRRTGAFLDDAFLLDFLTADEYLLFTGITYGLSREAVEEAVRPYQPFLARGVLDAPDRQLRHLSTGNRKKVGLVGALLSTPELVVLDEPFANLDPGAQLWLVDRLRWMNRSCGTTLVLSSHDLGHVVKVCGRIAVLDHGVLALDTPTSDAALDELRRFFTNRFTTRLDGLRA